MTFRKNLDAKTYFSAEKSFSKIVFPDKISNFPTLYTFSVVSDMRHPSSGRRLLCGQEVGAQPPEAVSLKCLRVGNTVSLPEEALERCAEQMRVVVFEV